VSQLTLGQKEAPIWAPFESDWKPELIETAEGHAVSLASHSRNERSKFVNGVDRLVRDKLQFA
jgi:hypothetical protein